MRKFHKSLLLAMLMTWTSANAQTAPNDQVWVDVTSYVVNPDLHGNSTAGWTISTGAGGSAATNYEIQEFWNCNFNFQHQTITDIPNGLYRVSVNAFQRLGEHSQELADNWEYSYGPVVLYANEENVSVKNVYSEWLEENIGECKEYYCAGAGKYVYTPNTMWSAMRCLWWNKMFYNELEVEVTDGTLTFGLTNNGGNINNSWCALANWKLAYKAPRHHGDEAPAKHVPNFSPLSADGTSVQYLYNVERGTFAIAGNNYATRASHFPGYGAPFKISIAKTGTPTYRMKNYVPKFNQYLSMFAEGTASIYMDNDNGANAANWTITPNGDGTYTIGNTGFAGQKLSANIDTQLYLVDEGNTTWAFVNEDDYEQYILEYKESLPAEGAYAEYLKIKDVKEIVQKMSDELASTNIYTQEAYNAFISKYPVQDWMAACEDNTIDIEAVNKAYTTNFAVTQWHASNDIDDLLTSAWEGADGNFGGKYYINTWSTEGENDGSDFKVPFFEYWTQDAYALAAYTMTATMTGLVPGAEYAVSSWTRVQLKNGATAPAYGITFKVGDGEEVDVCTGKHINGTSFYLAEVMAKGHADEDGQLTISYIVNADNNVSWLAWKNMKYGQTFSTTTYVGNQDSSTETLTVEQLKNVETANNELLFVEAEIAEELPANIITKNAVGEWVAKHIKLTDGKPVYCPEEVKAESITYTRDFGHTGWQAIFLPFDLPESGWQGKAAMAYINDVHQFDDNHDGDPDRTTLEFFTVRGGRLRPNVPYIVMPTALGETMFTATNTTLTATPATNAFVDCSSTTHIYTIYGTYQPKTDMFSSNAYALANGGFCLASSDAAILSPFRLYLTVTSRLGEEESYVRPQRISLMVDGEEEWTTDAVEQPTAPNPASLIPTPCYDLQGRRVAQPQKGIFIQGGKKVVIR